MMHEEIEKYVCDKFIKSGKKRIKTFFSFKAFQSQHCFGAGRSVRRTGKENQHNKGNKTPQNSKSVFLPIQCSSSFVHISEMFTVLPIKKTYSDRNNVERTNILVQKQEQTRSE